MKRVKKVYLKLRILYIELNKLNDDEIKYFPTLIGCYNKKQSGYTPEIIRQRLIKLGYSIAFVDYLTNNSKTNIDTQAVVTEDEKSHDSDTEIDLSDINFENSEETRGKSTPYDISTEDNNENICFVADTNF